MESTNRRDELLGILERSESAIKGTDLADKFSVTRQVIVQDIAILRARGITIIATPQGYIIPPKTENTLIRKTIVSSHKGYDHMEDELRTIVDLGGKIIDVIVDHPLYGEIKSPINVGSRYELDEFMKNIRETKAEPLSSLTDGLHLHTLEVKDENTFNMIKKALKEKNYLFEGQ
ncbi:transcription repressor NadR [Tissierella creatinini]|nr:transcription repressor NadR [Tissierella creatinini]TJX62538.1 transcription repressor NadR [Soehngenia saccharolytica]